jgi:HSP20 family molecular chaperone IbpA
MLVTRPRPVSRTNRSFDPFDRAFAQLSAGLLASTPVWRGAPSVTPTWRGDQLELTVDLPGVPRDAVSVEVADRTVTIAVEHAVERDGGGEELRWSRAIQLGGALDPDSVIARYVDGRLTVTVSPAPKPAARRVELTDGNAAEPIDAASTDG